MKGFCSKQNSRLLQTAVVFFTLQSTAVFAGGYASGWDCQKIDGTDWVCRSSQASRYQQSLEDISSQRQQIAGTFAWLKINVPNLSEQLAKALPVKKAQQKTVAAYVPEVKSSSQSVSKEADAFGEYTIQWLVARSIEPVKRLKARLKLPDTRILQYKKYNADWYVLVQGKYSTKAVARQVLARPEVKGFSNALRPRVRQDSSFDALGAVAWIPKVKKNIPHRRIAKVAPQKSYTGYVQRNTRLPKAYKPGSIPERVTRDSRRRSVAAARLPVKPTPATPIVSYVRKESVITQDYQAPVMAPRLPIPAPYPAAGNNKPVTQFPQAAMSVTDLHQAAQGSHTIQWYAAETLVEAKRFKAYYPALNTALIAKTDNRGRSWYLVLQGIFRDGKSAMVALQQPDLSRTASTLSPWIRPVAGLHKLQSVKQSKQQPALKKQVKTPQVITLPPSSLKLSSTRPSVLPVKPQPEKAISFTPEPVQPRFLQAPDSSFTIQWYAANDPFQVKKFQARYPKLAEARMVYFKRNGLDWYVLVDGVFESNHEALGFLKSNSWQPLANHLHPWTRSFRGLKKLAAREVGSR